MKSDKMKDSSEKACYVFKWMVLPLTMIAGGFVCATLIVMNTEPVRRLTECKHQLQNNTALLEKYMEILAETQSSLKDWQNRSARQSEEIAALEMKVKERDLVNANLAAKQHQLEDAVKKQQQQLHGCEENVAATNEQLQRAESRLRQCQWDRGRCQQQLSNHTSTMHRSSIFWTVLALLCLTLLYG